MTGVSSVAFTHSVRLYFSYYPMFMTITALGLLPGRGHTLRGIPILFCNQQKIISTQPMTDSHLTRSCPQKSATFSTKPSTPPPAKNHERSAVETVHVGKVLKNQFLLGEAQKSQPHEIHMSSSHTHLNLSIINPSLVPPHKPNQSELRLRPAYASSF